MEWLEHVYDVFKNAQKIHKDIFFQLHGSTLGQTEKNMCPAKVAFWRWDVEKLMSSHDLQIPVTMLSTNHNFRGKNDMEMREITMYPAW